MFVPVVDQNHKPLMPTTPPRARRWIQRGEATPFWDRGTFCVRLNREPSGRETQDIAVGIDPGSKKLGITVKSAAHTYFNVQADAVTHVQQAVADRREARRARRQRNTPCRQPQVNRAGGGIPPSTLARWQWKLRLLNWLKRCLPITHVVVENIRAKSKGQRRWDVAFSPLEVGKEWFYTAVRRIASLATFEGFQTKEMRDALGLSKIKKKTAEVFAAHCVDSWVLANAVVGGHRQPDNTRLLCLTPLRLHRRELHRRQPGQGGKRSPYGGTRSLGLKRGALVRHVRYGVTFVGGTSKGRISLHHLGDGRRLCQNAKPSDVHFLAYSTWRARLLPMADAGGLRRDGTR
jgi:hypothetical protein